MSDPIYHNLARRLDGKLTDQTVPPIERTDALVSGVPSGRSRIRVRAPVWVALGVALGVGVQMRSDRPESTLARAFQDIDRIAIQAGPSLDACVRTTNPNVVELEGPCTWRSSDPAMTVSSIGSSRLRTAEGVVRIESGWLVFDVDPVTDRLPVQLAVSVGIIEVIGTRFSIYQDAVRGHVELVEGKIRLIQPTGAVTELEPGDRFAWEGSNEAQAHARHDRRQASKRPPKPAADETSISDIARLRIEGRYLDALDLARRLGAQTKDRHVQEVLNYEVGTIIEEPLNDASAACRHWQRHLSLFPAGRYDERVRDRLARLQCDVAAQASAQRSTEPEKDRN